MRDDAHKGRPLALEQTAQSVSPTEPAFVAPPEGAPVYHGFVVLNDVTADGFTLGKITDFGEEGDALRNRTGLALWTAPELTKWLPLRFSGLRG